MRKPNLNRRAEIRNALQPLFEDLVSVLSGLIDGDVIAALGKFGGSRREPIRLLTTKQVAEILGVHPATVTNWRCQQVEVQPPYHRVMKNSIRYRSDELEAWILSQTQNPLGQYRWQD